MIVPSGMRHCVLIGQIVREIETTDVGGLLARIVQLHPIIVISVAGIGITARSGYVAGHPFVDEDGDGWWWRVGRAGSGVVEYAPFKRLAVGIIAVGLVGAQSRSSSGNPSLAVPAPTGRARPRRQWKGAKVKLVCHSFASLCSGWPSAQTIRNCPGWSGRRRGTAIALDWYNCWRGNSRSSRGHWCRCYTIRSTVIVLAEAIGRAGDIIGLGFVQPQEWIGR